MEASQGVVASRRIRNLPHHPPGATIPDFAESGEKVFGWLLTNWVCYFKQTKFHKPLFSMMNSVLRCERRGGRVQWVVVCGAARWKQVVGRNRHGADKPLRPEVGRDVAVERRPDALEYHLPEPLALGRAYSRTPLLRPDQLDAAVLRVACPADRHRARRRRQSPMLGSCMISPSVCMVCGVR